MYHPLGEKMADSPVYMAQFKPRDIEVPDSPEEDVKKAFLDQWKKDKCEEVIANLASIARIYGVGSLALMTKGVPVERPVDFKELWQADISFSVYDPLNTAGSLVLNQNPDAIDFMKVEGIRVSGHAYHRSRAVTLMNERPIYLGYTVSAFGYVGRSVYQRALFPLKSFIGTMRTDDLISQKAGLLIAMTKQAGSIIDNMMKSLFGLKRQQLQQGQTYGVLGIGPEDKIESLNLQNIDGAGGFARKNILENIAVAADMPAKLLNAETFAEGFGEGSEDAKHVARYVDRVRTWMHPAYEFMDKICMYRAWNPEFFKIIQTKYPDEYGDMTFTQAFYRWKNSFTSIWPDLLTEPKSEQSKSDKVKLEAVISLLEVLLTECDPDNKAVLIEWAADNINAMEALFDSPLNLDYEELANYTPPQMQMGGGGEEGDKPKPLEFKGDSVNVSRVLTALRKSDKSRRLIANG